MLEGGSVMNKQILRAICFITAGILALSLAGCGGGGGSTSSVGPTPSNPSTQTAVTSYLVDGPVLGVTYTCAPSGRSGTTDGAGTFACSSGDTATFTLGVGSGAIDLGSVTVPSSNGVSVPVTVLQHGLQVAEILQALNHGTTNNMDVSGLQVSASAVTAINAYIASDGVQLNGLASDDQFLTWIQQQTSGVSFTTMVSGTGTTFRDQTVLPSLQATVIAISATNPIPPVVNNTTKLSGTILVTGSGTIPAVGSVPSGSYSYSGGGILNATVSGDIQTPGTYAASWSTPGFFVTTTIKIPGYTVGTTYFPPMTTTQTENLPPISGNSPITVASAFSGNTLTVPGGTPPSGCSMTDVTGQDIGLSNPLITLTQSISCNISGGTDNATVTIKMVGAW